MPLTSDADLRALLDSTKTIAVVGYSDDPNRASHEVAEALRGFGYTVYPVNPALKSMPDVTVYASLADVPQPVDVVDVFRRPEFLPGVVEEAIAIGAKAVWMQLGIVNAEAAARAEAAGLKVVMDHCMKVEHHRLMR